MADLNRVYLVGNLTRDPEVRYLPSGTAVCEMALALNERYRNKAGEDVETTHYVDVVVWERQAENCGKYLTKGSPVLIEGSLQQDKWQTKEGENRSKLRVRASRVQFLSKPARTGEMGDGPAPSGSARSEPPGGSRDNTDFPPPADEEDVPF